MTQNESLLSFPDGPFQQKQLCVRCNDVADIHLVLLDSHSPHSGNFCLSCGEIVMHSLRKQRLEHTGMDQAAERALDLSAIDGVHKSFSPGEHSSEESEAGIIYWEGQGWSSDGPFAGA